MSKTEITVPDIGQVFITRKRGQRSIRLKVDLAGNVQVSMPWLASKHMAVAFIKSKQDWIIEQQAERIFKPYNGMLIGKTLRLMLMQHSSNKRSKRLGSNVIVYFDGDYDADNQEHLSKISTALTKALREEAERILLPRLRELADMYGFRYNSSTIKLLTGRWGSCDSKQHIILNMYLVQLPIEYIDYVIIHELAHTQHLNHSQEFWQTVATFCPEYKELRKKMRAMQPRIYDAKAFMA